MENFTKYFLKEVKISNFMSALLIAEKRNVILSLLRESKINLILVAQLTRLIYIPFKWLFLKEGIFNTNTLMYWNRTGFVYPERNARNWKITL